jgi:hypothetical protein
MASLPRTYTEPSSDIRAVEPRTRFGGPRRRSPAPTQYERDEYYGATNYHGSHMPLDTTMHWDWRNPLNILPGLILLLLVVALVASVLA